MTREEAIRILQGAIKKPNTKDGYLGQALDIAIKALEQEPCEDAVSRQAVTDAVENTIAKYIPIFIGRYEKIPLELAMAVKDLPPVIPQESKTGHWKAFIHNAYHGTDEDGEPIWRKATVYNCSQCNRRTVIKEKYCPNCAAKMESWME